MLHCALPARALPGPGARRGSSRSLHAFTRSARCHGAAFGQPKPAGAGPLHLGDLCQRAIVVLGATAVHQDGAAAARRFAGGVGGGDGVFPIAAAPLLCPFALSDSNPQPPDSRGRGPSPALGRIPYPCAVAAGEHARAVDVSRRGAGALLDRGDRAYLHRYRRGAAIVGAAAIALSPDLGLGVPVAPAAAAPIDVEGAAAGDHGRGRPARGRRRTESAADARRPPALLLRHCDGLPWRAGAHPPGCEISHRLLCRVVIRRNDRRIVRRADRALYVFMDRGIPDPAGTGGVVPPARRQRAFAALEQLVLAVFGRARDRLDRAVLVGGQGRDMAWRTPGLGGRRRPRALGIAGARTERQPLENLRNRP